MPRLIVCSEGAIDTILSSCEFYNYKKGPSEVTHQVETSPKWEQSPFTGSITRIKGWKSCLETGGSAAARHEILRRRCRRRLRKKY